MNLDLTSIKECGFFKRSAENILEGASQETAHIEAFGEMMDEMHLMLRTLLLAQGKPPGTVIDMGPDEREKS